MILTALIILAIIVAFVAKGKFQRPLLNTEIEVLCQNTGRTFRIYTQQAMKSVTCRTCGRETFIVHLGQHVGDVSVQYIEADGTTKWLQKVVPGTHPHDTKLALAQYYKDTGSFILIKQEPV